MMKTGRAATRRFLIGVMVLCGVVRMSVHADCMGCPPTATLVTLTLKDDTTLTGYLIVHHSDTERVIDDHDIDAEYFPEFSPHATEQQNALKGKAFLYRKGTTHFPPPVKGHAFYEPGLSNRTYTRLYEDEYQGVADISLHQGTSAIVLIGTPLTCSLTSIARIERRSETYWDVWYLAEAKEPYLSQSPRSAFEYTDEFGGRLTCFYYDKEVTLDELLQHVNLQTIIDDLQAGENTSEGVVCFQIGGST